MAKEAKTGKILTSDQIFESVVKKMKKDNMLPDSIEYALPNTSDPREIDTEEIDALAKLDYGSSEGIYLDIFFQIRDAENNNTITVQAGTIKTLLNNKDGMEIMGQLYGNFMYMFREFVYENYDLLNRRNYSVIPYKQREDGTFERMYWSYPNIPKEKIEEKVRYCFSKSGEAVKGIAKVVVINNRNGKEHIYDREPQSLKTVKF